MRESASFLIIGNFPAQNSLVRELVPRLPMLIVMPPVENCLHAFPHLVRHHRPKESTEARALHMWIRGRTLIRGAFAILPLLSGDRDHLELTEICRPLPLQYVDVASAFVDLGVENVTAIGREWQA